MTYLKLDDLFAEHPKVDPLSDAAFRLHVAGLLMCSRLLTDGFVEEAKVSRLVPRYKRASLQALLDAGLWRRKRGGYEIHDYLDWNASRSAVEAMKERKRKAGQTGADARWQKP